MTYPSSILEESNKTTFKSIYEIILGIGEKWQDLNDIDRAALLEALAGKRAGNALAAALNNIDDLRASYETALNASGSAMKEQANYEQSIQFSIDRLKATAQDLAQDFMSSDFIKGAIDALNKILELIDEITESTGALVPIITTLGVAFAGLKLSSGITDLFSALKGLAGAKESVGLFSRLKDIFSKQITIGSSVSKAGEQIGEQITTGVLSSISKSEAGEMISDALLAEFQDGIDASTYATMQYGATLEELRAIEAGTIVTNEAVGASGEVAAVGLESAAVAGEAATISLGAIVLIVGAVVAGIVGLVAIYDALTISVEEATEYMEKWNKTLDENNEKLKSQKDLVEEVKDSYFDLAEGVNRFNNTNINLSDEDYKEFIRLNNELAEQFPELITGIDAEGNYIINLGDNAYEAAAKLQELIDRQERLNNIEIANALNDTFKNSKVLMDDNQNSIEKYEYQIENLKKSLSNISSDLLSERISSTNIEIMNMLVKSLKDSGLYNELIESGSAGYLDTLDEYGNVISEFYINTTTLNSEQKNALKDALDANSAIVKQDLIDSISQLETQLENEEFKRNATWQSFVLDNVVPAMHSKAGYNALNEAGKQLANALVSGLSSETASAMEQYNDPYQYIQEKILPNLDLIKNFKSKEGFSVMDLFSGKLSNKELIDLYNQIQEFFKANNIELSFSIGENANDARNNYNKIIEGVVGKNSRGNVDSRKLKEVRKQFDEITKDFTTEQLEEWNSINEGVGSVDDAVKNWNEHLKETNQLVDEVDQAFSKSKMIDTLVDMANGFDKIDEIYADIYDKGSFDFAKLDSKKFQEAFGNLGVDYETFIETIADHTDDLEYCQDAFNGLVDAYIRSTGVLDNVTEANKDVTESMLEMYGITNAHELVEQALIKTEAKAIVSKYNLADATSNDTKKLLEEIGAADGVKASLIAAEAAEVLFANSSLNAEQKISELNRIASAAWGAAAAMELSNLTDNRGFEHSFNPADYDENYIEHAWEKIQAKYSKMANAIITPEYGGGKSTKDAIDKANKSAEESKEIFDWIEKALQRQEEEINRLDKVVTATYRNWSTRNTNLLKEIDEITKKISMEQTAYEAYLRDAEAIPLSEEYKKLVREGAMYSEIITDKALKKNIKEYEELYNKAIAAKDAIEDLRSKIAALAKQKFDNVKSEFEGFTSEIEHFVNMIDKELSHVENMNKIAGKSFYRAKADQDAQKLEDLNKERTALMQALRDAEARGVEEGSADWIAMRNEIYSVDEAIAELTYELEDLKKKMKEVAKLNFENLKQQFENAISIVTDQVDLTDAVVSMTQNAGYIASREYYKALIEGSKENVTGLRKEYEKLSSTLSEAMNAGDIEKYSEEWYSMNNDIMDVKKNLVDAANATIEYANALRQIDWDVFDRGLSRLKLLVDESEFFQELMSWDDKLKDDNGDWTKKGLVKQGLIAQDYQAYMDSANAYGAEAEEIRKLLETDPKNTVLIDRMHELLGLQRESILAALKEKKALIDLVKEGYNALLEKIKKLIDEYKEALDQAKD